MTLKSVNRGITLVAVSVTTIGLAGPAGAALVVDWLQMAPGGNAGGFTLVNDSGQSSATGLLSIATGKGLSFVGYPANNPLGDAYWVGAKPDLTDSVAGDHRMNALDFRVVSQAGGSQYSIEITVPTGRELVLAIGGLRASSGTLGLGVTAGGSAISLIDTFEWNGGPGSAYTQDLDWNAGTGTLTTVAGASGDSQLAFLHVSPLAGADSKVIFSVPSGYLGGTGDTISIGVGLVVPEPGVTALLAFGGLFWAGRRKR